ncbi:MAG: hypothetical protein LBD99_02365, partial [Candidatus Margulisbacteria bacterium]|nr:hypothetical protein [Candidatus Margulisiibacteriota bacterium]
MEKKSISLEQAVRNQHTNLNWLFHKAYPHNTIIFSDMTGTLIERRADGFSAEQRDALLYYLVNGGKLALVTGDSIDTAQEMFLDKLR